MTGPLGQDTFKRPNQSGWGNASDGQLWVKTGPGTISVASNEGVLVSNGADTHVQLGSQTAENQLMLCRIAIGHANDICGVQARFTEGSGNTTTYKFLFYSGGLHLNKAVSGVNTQMTDVPFTMTPGVFYWFLFQLSGSSLSGRAWQYDTGEPAYFLTTITDTQVTGPGGFAVLGLTDPLSPGIKFDSFLVYSLPFGTPDLRSLKGLDTFLTFDNWTVFGDPGYVRAGAYQNTGMSMNGGLVGYADVAFGVKHAWQIRSKPYFSLPGIYAARINVSGDTGGGANYEKITKSFFLFNDPGDGNAYWYSDFNFYLEQNHPSLAGYPGQATPAELSTIIYAGSGSGFPAQQLSPLTLDDALFGDYITCIFKIELISSGVGTKTWKTTYQIVDKNGATRTIGTTTTTHSDTITSVQAWLKEEWFDPVGGPQTNYNWQRMDVRWFYYSGDTTDRTPYLLRDSLLPIDGRHITLDIASNGFVFLLPDMLGNVAIDASPGTSINILNLYQRSNVLSTQQLAEYVYALLAARGGGILVADTPVNINQIGGVGLVSGNLPINLVQVGGATAPMAGADGQTAANILLVALGIYNGTTVDRLRSGLGDGVGSTGLPGFAPYLFNGTNDDRERGNINTAALINAAAVTVGQTGADQTNFNGRGVIVVLDMTNVGTGSVTLVIQGKDAASGKYYALLTGAAVVTNSVNVYMVYPGAPATANVSANAPLPRTWRVITNANNANAASYTVGASVIV